jgi:hypothetical protein
MPLLAAEAAGINPIRTALYPVFRLKPDYFFLFRPASRLTGFLKETCPFNENNPI